MFAFLVRRLALMLFVFFGISVLTFTLVNFVPTDPVRAALGYDVSPEMVEQYRRERGFDQPAPVRYLVYVRNLLRGDLGTSIMTHRPVLEELKSRVPATLELSLVSLIFSIVAGGIVGVIAATRSGSLIDVLVTSVPLAQLSLPVFVLGLLLLLVFYSWLGWLPYGGRIDPGLTAPATITGFYTIDSLLRLDFRAFRSAVVHLLLPAVALSNLALPEMARMTRSTLLDILEEDYIRTARSKGLRARQILWPHALKNAAVTLTTVMGLRFGRLLGGAVVTETIFSWPGMGRFAWEGAKNFDLNVVMGLTLVVGFFYSLTNLLVDLSHGFIDPRVRGA